MSAKVSGVKLCRVCSTELNDTRRGCPECGIDNGTSHLDPEVLKKVYVKILPPNPISLQVKNQSVRSSLEPPEDKDERTTWAEEKAKELIKALPREDKLDILRDALAVISTCIESSSKKDALVMAKIGKKIGKISESVENYCMGS